jgi:epsilon-lactone hydrolase
MRTLAIEYRLAPENPFSAALDDAVSVWRFLQRNGIAAGHIAIGGDSAGGGQTRICRPAVKRSQMPANSSAAILRLR